MRGGPDWFQGTADAVYQNLGLIEDHRPDIVAVFGAITSIAWTLTKWLGLFGPRSRCAVAVLPMPLGEGHNFGIITPDSWSGSWIFRKNPRNPSLFLAILQHCLSSMGNYLFKTQGAH